MTESLLHPLSQVWSDTAFWGPKLLGVLLTLVLFYVLSRVVEKAIVEVARHFELDNHLSLILKRTSRIGFIIVGLITALGTLGINVSALVAGLGLTGFALGFALKDTISNLLAGILILLYQPFRIGDNIEVSGFSGNVTTIDLRYTELNDNGRKVLIPNSKLFTDPIIVLTSNPEKS